MTMSELDSLSSSFSSQCHWSDSDLAVHLRDFSARYALPNVVKVTKGQYRNIGVAKSVYNELYLHSIQTTPKVYAEGIKVKEGRRSVGTVEQRYAIPLTYEGWFELLSEDGRAVAPFYSVAELQQAFPTSCLVRESVKAFLADEAGQINLSQNPSVVSVGDQLTLIRNASLPTPGLMGSSKKNYLCCHNFAGDTIFIPADQKGLFSPIAGQGNISGVHNIKGLLEKFRMPFKVRLVHGVVPGKMDRSFTGCFRFVSVFSDETAFVCPLKKDAKLVPVSLKEPLKVVPVQNFDELRTNEECKYYDERSTRMTSNYLRSIHLLVTQPDVESVQKGQQELRRSLSTSDAMTKSKKNNTAPEEDMLFSEIDEIYQYVRQGGIPPVPRARPKSEGAANTEASRHKAVYVSSRSPPGTKERKQQPQQQQQRQKQTAQTANDPDEHYWEDPVYADITVFQKKPQRETDPRHKGKLRPRSKSETTLPALAAKHGDTGEKQPDIPVAQNFDDTDGTITFDPEPASDNDSNASDKAKAAKSSKDNGGQKGDYKPSAPPVESMPSRSPLERSNSRSPADSKPTAAQDKTHLSDQGKEQTEPSAQQNDKQEPKGNSNVMNIKRNSGPVANLRQLYRGITAMKSNKDSGDNSTAVVSQSYRKLSDTMQPRHSSSAEELSDKLPTEAGLSQSLSSPALTDRPQSPEMPPSPVEPRSPIDLPTSNSLSLPVSKSPATSSGSKSPTLSKDSPVPLSSSPPPSPTPTTPSPESTTSRPGASRTNKEGIKGERIIYGENEMLYKNHNPNGDGPERLVYGVTSKTSLGPKSGPEVLVYSHSHKLPSRQSSISQSNYNLYRKSQDPGLALKLPTNGDRKSLGGFFGKKSDSRTITGSSQISRPNSSGNSIKVYNHYMPPRSPPVPIVTASQDGTAKALNPGYNNRSSTYRSTPMLYSSQYLSPTAAVTVTGQANGKHPGYVAVARVDRDSGYGAPGSESPTHYDYSNYNSLDRNMYNLHL